MKTFNLLILLIFVTPVAFAMDEADIPPPPMPEYMKKHQADLDTQQTEELDRDIASDPPVHLKQSEEDIKQEFLQAGEENEDVAEDIAVQEVQEGSIEEAAEQEMAQQPAEVFEEPVKAPIEEVSEVQESEKEFEQANMDQAPSPPPVEVVQEEVVENEVPAEEPAEKLAEVEETLEQAEEQAEARLENARIPSSKKKFKAGMYKFSEKCMMHKEPSSMSDEAGSIRAGRKLWIDPHNDSWHKAYKKSGTVYISADCIPN